MVNSADTVCCFKIINLSFLCSSRLSIFSHENLHTYSIRPYDTVDCFSEFLKH